MMPRSARFLTHPIFSQSGFGKHHPLSIPRHSAVIGLCGTLGWLDAGETVACPLPDAGVLARYERWRRFDSASLALGTDALNRLFSNDFAPLRLVRDVGMSAVGKIPTLRRFFMRQAGADLGRLPPLMQPER